jgi:hypothetical protein
LERKPHHQRLGAHSKDQRKTRWREPAAFRNPPAHTPHTFSAKRAAWIDKQDASLARPEAIRVMMETILHILSKGRGEKPAKKAKGK